MGQKVNPLSMRVCITETWRSRWYAGKQEFGTLLVEDSKIRKHIKEKYGFAGIPRVDIERTRDEVRVVMHCMRPGVIIGRKGAEIDLLRAWIEQITKRKVNVTIREVPRPELNAQLVAESVGEQLMKRASFKRALKKAAEITMEAGALGVRLKIGGRLGGAEMARTERLSMGSIPLSTLRAKVDYGLATVTTTYGVIGIKCWVYLGEVDESGVSEVEARVASQAAARPMGGAGRGRGPGGPGGAGGRGGAGGGRPRRGGPRQQAAMKTRIRTPEGSEAEGAAEGGAPQAPEGETSKPAGEAPGAEPKAQ